MCCSSNSHRTPSHIGQTSILLSLVMLPMKCYGFVTKEAVKVLKGSILLKNSVSDSSE